MRLIVSIVSVLIHQLSIGQSIGNPIPTKFMAIVNRDSLPDVGNPKTGFKRSITEQEIHYYSTDYAGDTFVLNSARLAISVEGVVKSGKRSGKFQTFLLDAVQPSKKYLLFEQDYKNNKRDGYHRIYSVNGELVQLEQFSNDSLNGLSKTFHIDGKTVVSESYFYNGTSRVDRHELYPDGSLKRVVPIVDGLVIGIGRKYYHGGVLEEEVHLKNGGFDGERTYYHPNSQLWLKEVYKDGKSWTVVSNQDSNGTHRNPGTLKDGNGTIIFYNNDGSIRETALYRNGIRVQ